MRSRARILTALTASGVLLLTGCTSGGDAVTAQGEQFQLVTPGGETYFSYTANVRKTAGDISGPPLDSRHKRIDLSTYKNEVLVLNFWASWCAPCRSEQSFLSEVARNTTEDGVQFIGINTRDNRSSALDFQTTRAVPYPSIYDTASRVGLSLRGLPLSGLPSTLILDRQHRVAEVWVGQIQKPSQFIAALNRISKE